MSAKPNNVYIIRIRGAEERELADVLKEILPEKTNGEEKEGGA